MELSVFYEPAASQVAALRQAGCLLADAERIAAELIPAMKPLDDELVEALKN